LVAGTKNTKTATGLARSAQQNASTAQAEAIGTRLAAKAERSRRLAGRLDAATVPGQAEFVAALAAVHRKDRYVATRRRQHEAALRRAKEAGGRLKQKALNEALAIQQTIGPFEAHYNGQLKRAATTLRDSLLDTGAIDQAQRIQQLIDDPRLASGVNGFELIADLRDSLNEAAALNEADAAQFAKQAEAEQAASRDQRAKLAKARAKLLTWADQDHTEAVARYRQRVELRRRAQAAVDAYHGHRDVKKRTEPVPQQVVDLLADMDDNAKALSDFGDAVHPDDELIEALDTVLTNLPDDDPDRLGIEALTATIRLRRMNAEHALIAERIRTRAAKLPPGSSVESSLDLEIGGYVGIPGLKLEATGLIGLKQKIERVGGAVDGNRAWKATFEHSERLSVNGKALDLDPSDASKAALKLNLEAGTEFSKARTYDTLEELIQGESDLATKLMCVGAKADLDKGTKTAKRFLDEREKLVVTAHQMAPQLRRLLERRAGIAVDLDIAAPAFTKGAQVTTTTTALTTGSSFALGAGSQTGFSLLGGLNQGYKEKRKQQQSHLSVPYLSTLKDKPDLAKSHRMASPQLFAFYRFNGNTMTGVEYGPSAADEFDRLERVIRDAREVLNDPSASEADRTDATSRLVASRDTIRRNLEGLHHEYSQYVELSNDLALKRISDSKQTRTFKQRPLAARNLKPDDDAGFVRAMSLQYAVAHRLFVETFAEPSHIPAVDRRALEQFRQDLETPRLGLDRKQIAKAFGVQAAGKIEKVNTATISFGFSAGYKHGGALGDITDGADTISGSSPGTKGTGLGTLGVNVEAVLEEKYAKGKAAPDTKVTIEFQLGHAGSAILSDGALTAIAAKILSGTDIIPPNPTDGSVVTKHKLVNQVMESLKSLRSKALTGPVQIELALQSGSPEAWVLKQAQGFSQTTRNVGLRVAAGNVIGGFNATHRTKVVVETLRAATSLQGLTDTYRNAGGDGDGWHRYKQESTLFSRLVEQLDAETGTATLRRTGKANLAFEAVLDQVNNGVSLGDQPVLSSNPKNRATLTTDLVRMLVDLKDGSQDEAQAATNLIRAWKARKALADSNGVSGVRRQRADAELAAALDGVIQAKAAKEDRTADDDYQAPVGFTTDQINQMAIDELSKRFAQVRADTAAEATTLPGLRAELLHRYAKATTKAQRVLGLNRLRRVLALEYAASTIDDLTATKDEGDKEKALGKLVAGLDDLAGTKNPNRPDYKVYVTDMIDGQLVADDKGHLHLKMTVQEDYAGAVDEDMLRKAHRAAIKAINAGVRSPDMIDSGFDLTRVVVEQDGVPTPWRTSLVKPEVQQKKLQERADKRYPATILTSRKGRRQRYRRNYGSANHADILQAIAVVLDQQRQAKRRQPGPSQSTSKAKH
jgi:hypothetical protein